MGKDFSKAAQVRVFKVTPIKTVTADGKFSVWIRHRDPMCRRCRIVPSSDCSHYWKRGDSGTRFDPKNCVGLCRDCHTIWERQKNNEYKAFMIEWLGKEEYDALETRARSFKNRTEAVLEFMAWHKLIPST
jgi:hypothetical protein